MKLVACLYIDDDGLGGTLAIYDSPCSQPACIHANLPLSPGEVATMLAYIEHVARGGRMERVWASRHDTGSKRSISFGPEKMCVAFHGVATFLVEKENVLLDMSNECAGLGGGEDTVSLAEVRAAIEDIE